MQTGHLTLHGRAVGSVYCEAEPFEAYGEMKLALPTKAEIGARRVQQPR